jgi:hypothetical protein
MAVNTGARDYWDDWGPVLLWTTVLSGPAAWALNELIGYAFVKPVCANGHRLILTLISGGGLALALVGLWIGWWCFAQVRDAASEEGARTIDRSYFMAIVGLGLNSIAAVYIVIMAIVPYLVGACES